MKTNNVVRGACLIGFNQLVKRYGGNPEELLSRVGLDINIKRNPDEMIDYESYVKVLEMASEELSVPSFGLEMSEYHDFHVFGLAGLLLQNCRTVREAAKAERRYLCLHCPAEYWHRTWSDDYSYITLYSIYQKRTSVRQVVELSMATAYRLTRTLVGKRFQGGTIEFRHHPLSPPSVYKHYLGNDINFNQENDRFITPNCYLDIPLPNTDSDSKGISDAYLESLLKPYKQDLELQVRALILQLLGVRKHGIDNIASILGLDKRTLQRKLKLSGTSFKNILDEVRYNHARWNLASSNIPLTQLSESLGYSDIAAFSRAFKMQSGLSPRSWRQRHTNLKGET